MNWQWFPSKFPGLEQSCYEACPTGQAGTTKDEKTLTLKTLYEHSRKLTGVLITVKKS
jgi:hypothetical protein